MNILLPAILLFSILLSCTNTRQQENKKNIPEPDGKALFMQHCSQCHNPNMQHDMTAPALATTLEKRSLDWIKTYIQLGTDKAVEQGDSIALNLRSEGWALMPGFDFLSSEQIDAILDFVKDRSGE